MTLLTELGGAESPHDVQTSFIGIGQNYQPPLRL